MTTLTLILAIFIAQGSPEPIQEARAAMRLGARAAHVQRNLPVLNQVVLVPDEATYLDEISRWSPRARWPVLFDREPLASQFIRRFNPEKIWRREPVKTKIDDIDISTLSKQIQERIKGLNETTFSFSSALVRNKSQYRMWYTIPADVEGQNRPRTQELDLSGAGDHHAPTQGAHHRRQAYSPAQPGPRRQLPGRLAGPLATPRGDPRGAGGPGPAGIPADHHRWERVRRYRTEA